MINRCIQLLIPFLLVQPVLAQSTLPVIRASSKNVSINDDGLLSVNSWNLSPAARPDIYTADRTRKTKWVSFYTDIDSIKIKLKPGTKQDFIILLNGKDSCYTQVESAIPPESKIKNAVATTDTIPFTLTSFNAIAVKAVINHTDTVKLHFDAGSFDFRLTKDAILKKTKLLSNQPDALAGTATPNYNHLNKVSTLQMGNTVYDNPAVFATTVTAHEMDGRFGWNIFEGKQVEIDYDNGLLIIHSGLPKNLKGYNKSKLLFLHSFVCMKGFFEIAHKKYPGNFLLDTGADQAVIADSGWAGKQHFADNLKLIRTSVLRDPRGVQSTTRIVVAPRLTIGNFELSNIPTAVLGGKNTVGFEVNYLGNDLLKRFNTILDFKNDNIYLKPNKLMGLPYRENS